MFTSHYECKFQFINELQVYSFQYGWISRYVIRFRFKLQKQHHHHEERKLSEWVSWMYDISHSNHISQPHYYVCIVLTCPFLSLHDSNHSHIKSAWAGLDVIIFYCSLYYRWYPLQANVSIICCKIKTLYRKNTEFFLKVIILCGGHRECLFIFVLK